MLVVAFIALALFAVCSFWMTRLAAQIRDGLEKRHPELLRRIAPDASAHWSVHWRWQGDGGVAWAALPLVEELGDEALKRDTARFKIGLVLIVATWATTALAFFMALL